MARLRIHLPDALPFRTEIPLLIGHINYGGHLDNAWVLAIVHEARLRFLQALGYTEVKVEGCGIIVSDAAVQYRSEAFHGEVMVVEMGVTELWEHGCDLPWRMTDQASGREVARGKTGIVFFDYATRRKVRTPEGFRRRFEPA